MLCAMQPCAIYAQQGAQQQQRKPQPSATGGGMATGAVVPPVYDAEKRPITAGGFVKTGPIVFQNVAEQAGLTKWHHTAGTPEKQLILEAKGPGVCLLDYDNDGWLDIYLVNGSTYDALERQSHSAARGALPQQPRRHLHRRDGKGRRGQ